MYFVVVLKALLPSTKLCADREAYRLIDNSKENRNLTKSLKTPLHRPERMRLFKVEHTRPP
jgi:hypothetical protein